MKKSNGGKNTALYEEERNIMAKTSSPWLTKLDYAFQVEVFLTVSHSYVLVMHLIVIHGINKTLLRQQFFSLCKVAIGSAKQSHF